MYCSRCGSKIENGAQFCPNCGAPVEPQFAKSVVDTIDTQGKDHTAAFSQADIQENKLLCILCYFGLLMLIPLLVKQDSAYVKFHCNQGLLLLLFNVISSVVTVIPFLGWVVGVVASIVGFVLLIIGIVNTCNGRAKTLPIIGGIATLIK